MKTAPLKSHQSAIVSATVGSLALLFVPYVQWMLLPMVYLNTHLHEFCHAIMAVGTGGSVRDIQVHADGSGVTMIAGGIGFLTNSAGYVGTAIIGALMMNGSRTDVAARRSLLALGVVLALSMLLWVRGGIIGVAAGLFWIGALLALVRFGKGRWLLFAGQFIGVQQCLQSGLALNELIKISALNQGDSDARNMELATHVPAMFWAIAWCCFSLVMVWLGLRRAWKPGPEPHLSHPVA